MAYVNPNFKSKKALKDAVKAGEFVRIKYVGLQSPSSDGIEYIEGPWYPEPHRWSAKVKVENGLVVKVK